MILNAKNVATLSLPAGKTDHVEFDDKLAGFGVRIREGGSKTWIVQYRTACGQRRKTIGKVSLIDADKARELAERDLASVTLGADPQAEKAEQRAREAQTFGSFVASFLAVQKRRQRPRSYVQVEAHLLKHWAPFHERSIHAIKKADVAAQLNKIEDERGPIARNRARTNLSAFYSWAIAEGVADANPVIGTRQADETPRERILTDDELRHVWQACDFPSDYSAIVRLLVLTGARRDEVGGMVKGELDLAARKWTLPAKRSKNKREHVVHLSDAALDILGPALAREGRDGRHVVFGEGAGGFNGWSRAKLLIDERIAKARGEALAEWTVHDLRRSAASGMAKLGVAPHVVDATLNHVSGTIRGVARVYNRNPYLPERRQALDLWAAHVAAIVEGRTASNVVTLRSA
jgi:integrase